MEHKVVFPVGSTSMTVSEYLDHLYMNTGRIFDFIKRGEIRLAATETLQNGETIYLM